MIIDPAIIWNTSSISPVATTSLSSPARLITSVCFAIISSRSRPSLHHPLYILIPLSRPDRQQRPHHSSRTKITLTRPFFTPATREILERPSSTHFLALLRRISCILAHVPFLQPNTVSISCSTRTRPSLARARALSVLFPSAACLTPHRRRPVGRARPLRPRQYRHSPPPPRPKTWTTSSTSCRVEEAGSCASGTSKWRTKTSMPSCKRCVADRTFRDRGRVLMHQSLDSLPTSERSAITQMWSTFSNAPHARRKLILEGILTMCCL